MSNKQQTVKASEIQRELNQDNTNWESSFLFLPQAIWVFLFCLAAGVWFRFIPLIVVSVFLIFLYIIINMWKKLALKNIKPKLLLSKSRLFAGEKFEIKASVYNDKWLPLVWLEWSFLPQSGIKIGDEQGEASTVRLLWLLSFQKVEWVLEAKTLKRGVYDLGQITLRSGDGFRFAEQERVHCSPGMIYVYPELIPVDASGYRPSKQWGVKGTQGGYIEDPLLITGIREYQAGDELRRLNWRASVRTGKLQTNVYQPVVTEQLLIFVDVQGYVINEQAFEDQLKQKEYRRQKVEAFERFLSIIASVAVKYNEMGISLGFATNAVDYKGEKMDGVLPGPSLTPFLDQLAKITQVVGSPKMKALDRIMTKGKLTIPLAIFCYEVTEQHYLWYKQTKSQLAEVSFCYQQKSLYAEHLAGLTKALNLLLSSPTSVGGESNCEAG
ncbi:MAG TPA: DUF58 domain-containing protein [Peptococcaceae bacterium]|nr:DUF58 domain-containing protein [Peptococcaceae bacterium]